MVCGNTNAFDADIDAKTYGIGGIEVMSAPVVEGVPAQYLQRVRGVSHRHV